MKSSHFFRGLLLFLVLSIQAFAVTAYTNATLTNSPVLVTSPAHSRQLLYFNISNPNTATVYVQFFDAATAGAVTLGVTTPNFWVAVPQQGVTDSPFTLPYIFGTGIVAAVTTTPTGSTAPSSNCPITIFYQ